MPCNSKHCVALKARRLTQTFFELFFGSLVAWGELVAICLRYVNVTLPAEYVDVSDTDVAQALHHGAFQFQDQGGPIARCSRQRWQCRG